METRLSDFRKDLFNNKSVFVSGGTSGIGLGVARAFAAHGAKVTAAGSTQSKVDELNSLDGDINFIRLDVTDQTRVEQTVNSLETLDVLVNMAGIARPNDEYNVDGFLNVIDVNLNSVMWACSAAKLKLTKTGGNIINTASMLSYLTDTKVPGYGASKAGVLGLTRHLAHAWAGDGIRVNAITPGYVATPLTTGLQDDPELTARILQRCAIKRWGTVDDMVGTVLFLASDSARYITGADIAVDGGFVSGGF